MPVATSRLSAAHIASKPPRGRFWPTSERRQWELGDGTVAHHLIDPRTGAPCVRGTAVVIGEDPVAADVLASCVVLDAAFLDTLDAPAARIDIDGTITATPDWAEAGA